MNRIAGLAIAASCLMVELTIGSCARFQPNSPAMSASDYTPTGMLQSVTMKDSSIHYDPSVLKPGTARSQVHVAFGEPNATRTTDDGKTEDVYAFNPGGSKFVNPQVRPRNIALAFLTVGTSAAVRQARLSITEKKLTLYHVLYTPNDIVQSVREEKMSDAPAEGPAVQPPGSSSGQPQSAQPRSGIE